MQDAHRVRMAWRSFNQAPWSESTPLGNTLGPKRYFMGPPKTTSAHSGAEAKQWAGGHRRKSASHPLSRGCFLERECSNSCWSHRILLWNILKLLKLPGADSGVYGSGGPLTQCTPRENAGTVLHMSQDFPKRVLRPTQKKNLVAICKDPEIFKKSVSHPTSLFADDQRVSKVFSSFIWHFLRI